MYTEAESTLIILLNPHLKKFERDLLFHSFSSAKKIIYSSQDELHATLKCKDLVNRVLKWHDAQEWQVELEQVCEKKIRLLSIFDTDYPEALKELSEPPPLLYIKGTYTKNLLSFGIVGTRKATLYGKEQAEKISQELARENIVIISGFAEGIDRSAHCGALKEGVTYGILGSGLNVLYPSSNKDLEAKIIEKGALISEFSLNAPPHAYHFPLRNRIVSALSKAVLVVESPLKGGSMITVQKALELNKKVYALPGRVDSENFQGNHALIKEKKAELVENAQDILRELGKRQLFLKSACAFPSLSQEEEKLYSLLPNEEKCIDELVLLTQFPIMQLNVLLTRLLLKKVVKEYPGKIFKKILSKS